MPTFMPEMEKGFSVQFLRFSVLETFIWPIFLVADGVRYCTSYKFSHNPWEPYCKSEVQYVFLQMSNDC